MIKGAQGVKVLAKNLEKTLAGLPIFVASREDELLVLKYVFHCLFFEVSTDVYITRLWICLVRQLTALASSLDILEAFWCEAVTMFPN